LAAHPLRGQLFETMIVADFLKSGFNAIETKDLYYFRDNNSNEVDLVTQGRNAVDAVETKSSGTYDKSFMRGLDWFAGIAKEPVTKTLVYGGAESFSGEGGRVLSWLDFNR
jgi:uncharacterized protein